MLQTHGWTDEKHKKTAATPLSYGSHTIKHIETEQGPRDEQQKQKLAQTMVFSYWQAIRELLFAANICWTDVLYACIKLSC